MEFDNDEAESIIKIYSVNKLEKFLPEIIGIEHALEAMDAMRKLVREVRDLLPPEDIDYDDFYSANVVLTSSQLSGLMRYANKLTLEDVKLWGYPKNVSTEVINAMWSVKSGLMRAFRNIDPPLR
jgi:hypothetical protein